MNTSRCFRCHRIWLGAVAYAQKVDSGVRGKIGDCVGAPTACDTTVAWYMWTWAAAACCFCIDWTCGGAPCIYENAGCSVSNGKLTKKVLSGQATFRSGPFLSTFGHCTGCMAFKFRKYIDATKPREQQYKPVFEYAYIRSAKDATT